MITEMEFETAFKTALSYGEYRNLIDSLVATDKTTGENQSEKLLEFTKLNVHRMKRLDKTIQLTVEDANRISNNNRTYKWLLIGDAWCGDCAQIIPVINKIAEHSNGKIQLRIISRDTLPQLIESFLTNGAKAIPKLLLFNNESKEVIGSWGPRPKPAQEIMLNWKVNSDKISWEDFEKNLHLWYTKDKGLTIIDELMELINKLESI